MTFKDAINEAMFKYLEYAGINSVTEVLHWSERTVYGGYCETCSYEELVLDIKYIDADGKAYTHTYSGSFADFIYTIDYLEEHAQIGPKGNNNE